ncbi:MFS transporter [Rothia uropygialis]|uniref:MFS transporter n=1 Tax=Kocuria sp. 36 TaxID=1415402 RepID=UPI001930F41A|nr:MFS transporter [Kocuria sp. 36]
MTMNSPQTYGTAERLDRLPHSRHITLIVFLISLGTFWDAYMLYSIGPISSTFLSSLGDEQLATRAPTALFFGTFLGAIIFGRLADRIGRRNAFTLNLSILAVGNIFAVLSPNGVILIIALIIAGLGTGAEIPLSSTYTQEFMPAGRRGKATALMLAFGFLGGTVGGFVARFIGPAENLPLSGFRIALLIGAAGALVTIFIRRRVPESPRWLDRKERYAEADAILSGMEQRVMAERNLSELPEPQPAPPMDSTLQKSSKTIDLLRPAYLRRTLCVWIIELFQGFGAYGFTTFVPVILTAKGYSIVDALGYTALIQISYPIGCLVASQITDRINRKWGMTLFYTLNMLCGVAFYFSDTVPMILLFGFLTEMLVFIDGPMLHTYEVEIYPTHLRGLGAGTSFGLSRLGGFLAPLAAGGILALAGQNGATYLIVTAAGSWLVCAATAAVLGIRTKDVSLERLESSLKRIS